MRPVPSLTPVLFAILACGPGTGASTGTDTDTGSSTGTGSGTTITVTGDVPTTGDTTTGTSASTTSTGTTDPGSGTTVDPSNTDDPFPATTTGTSTTDTSTTGTSTTDTSTGGQDSVEYAAIYVPGGLDRIVVRKADFDADLCTSVVFVWPMPNIQPDLVLPEMWSYQDAEIAQGTADCLEFMGWLPDAVAALDIGGTADWPSPGPCPGTLDIDVTLLIPQDMPWVPAQNTMSATGLPLQGC